MRQVDCVILKKIVSYCDDISDIILRFGNEEASYRSDRAYQYATGMCIMQIGELTARLSDEAKAQMPDIPWRMIRGMRNIYAHNYERAEPGILWQTITEEVLPFTFITFAGLPQCCLSSFRTDPSLRSG